MVLFDLGINLELELFGGVCSIVCLTDLAHDG
jgi:hypothetical protein